MSLSRVQALDALNVLNHSCHRYVLSEQKALTFGRRNGDHALGGETGIADDGA